MTGICTVNSELFKLERGKVLQEFLSTSVLADYECWAFPIDQLKRINRFSFFNGSSGLSNVVYLSLKKLK